MRSPLGRFRVFAIFLGLPAALAVTQGCAEDSTASDDPATLLARSTGLEWVVELDPDYGTPSFVQPKTDGPTYGGAAVDPSGPTLKFLRDHVDALRIDVRELEPESRGTDEDGGSHAAFTQRVGGLPVLGTRIAAHYDAEGHLVYINSAYRADLGAVDKTPVVTAAKAKDIARSANQGDAQREPELALDPGAKELVWQVAVARADVLVSARSGAVIRVSSHTRHAAASNKGPRAFVSGRFSNSADLKRFDVDAPAAVGAEYTLSNGRVAVTYQSPSGATFASVNLNSWPDAKPGTVPYTAKEGAFAAELYANMSLVDATYRETFGFDLAATIAGGRIVAAYPAGAVDNAGAAFGGGKVLHFEFGARANANDLVYSDIETVAHEFQHGVTDRTLKLDYNGQAGALDESISDVFAQLVVKLHEKSSNISAEGPALMSKLGETVGAVPARDFIRPDRSGQGPSPASMRWYEKGAREEPHINSTIPSNAWYLMTFGGKNITTGQGVVAERALGIEASRRLYWRTVSTKGASPRASFADFARALIANARTLPNGASKTGPVQSVACAWAATTVLTNAEVEKNWGVKCTGDTAGDGGLPDAAAIDCNLQASESCGTGNLCSWHGAGYCCRAEQKATKICYRDRDCAAGSVCARVSISDAKAFACVPAGLDACVQSAPDAGATTEAGASDAGAADAAKGD